MKLRSKVWYPREMAKDFPSLPWYTLKLKLTNGKMVKGYYFCNEFWCGKRKITHKVDEFLIPQEGEAVHLN